MANLYETLGISISSNQQEIKNAYRKLAFKYHPDRNDDIGAEAKFKEIGYAYSILGSPDKKADYDICLQSACDYSSTETLSYEDSLALFMKTMYAYATEMSLQNIRHDKISFYLQSKGCPGSVANTIARTIEDERKVMVRSATPRLLLYSIPYFLFGVVLIFVFPRFGGILILGGVYCLLKAGYLFLTGKLPSEATDQAVISRYQADMIDYDRIDDELKEHVIILRRQNASPQEITFANLVGMYKSGSVDTVRDTIYDPVIKQVCFVRYYDPFRKIFIREL